MHYFSFIFLLYMTSKRSSNCQVCMSQLVSYFWMCTDRRLEYVLILLDKGPNKGKFLVVTTQKSYIGQNGDFYMNYRFSTINLGFVFYLRKIQHATYFIHIGNKFGYRSKDNSAQKSYRQPKKKNSHLELQDSAHSIFMS